MAFANAIHPDDADAGNRSAAGGGVGRRTLAPLYTAAQRQRRDTTVWTLVQGVLAPVQFLIFAVSLGLVTHYLLTGDGHAVAA